MAARDLIRRIFRGPPADILAVVSDDLRTRAAVFGPDPAGGLRVEARYESKAPDLPIALAEIAGAMRAEAVRVPKRAILLSPRVHTAILQLPVSPVAPLPFREMQEMVKWELEPYMSQTRTRRIGAILVGRGHITWEDLRRLLADAERSGPVPAGSPRRRLGELAVESGLITPRQLEECLALQRAPEGHEGSAVCGWTPLDDAPADGKWRWLVAGMPDGFRKSAVAAFRDHGMRLRAIYPIVGCAGACLDGAAEKECIVFEYLDGHLGCVHFAGRKIAASRTVFSHEPGNPVHSCRELFDAGAERVWLAGIWPDGEAVARVLESALGRPCSELPVKVGSPASAPVDGAAIAGSKGAVDHYLGKVGRGLAVGVPAREPSPSLWRSRWFRLAGASGLACALLLAAAVHLRWKRMEMETIAEAAGRLEALEKESGALRARISDARETADFLRRVIPERQKLIPEILRAIEASLSDEIMLQRIAETTGGEIEVLGWGLSVRGIQSFRIGLQDHLPRSMACDDSQPIRQERWRTLAGYSFAMRIAPGNNPPKKEAGR